MPNKHGQVTEDDFRAPEGQFRTICEDMDDGELKIVSDHYDQCLAIKTVKWLAEENDKDVFTLWDDQGNGIH